MSTGTTFQALQLLYKNNVLQSLMSCFVIFFMKFIGVALKFVLKCCVPMLYVGAI